MSNLLLTNLSYNASDREIRAWIESGGVGGKSIRLVRDVVTEVSEAFGHVEPKGSIELTEAISNLDDSG